MHTTGQLWAIVLAGGAGRRLGAFVASALGHSLPKQFCAFGGTRSLLQTTMHRVLPLVPPRRCVVVVSEEHRPTAEAQLRGFRGVEIVDQPIDRGTAAGVLLPLTHVLAADPEARVLLLPSDHGFADDGLFARRIREVDRAIAGRPDSVVLFGASATAAQGDYGWIEAEREMHAGLLRRVAGFREKPGAEEAEELLRRGAFWNTMILLAHGRALRELYTQHLPDIAAAFRACGVVRGDERTTLLREIYPVLRSTDFSRDLISRAEGLSAHVWPADIGWTDLGTPLRLRAWLDESRELGTSTFATEATSA